MVLCLSTCCGKINNRDDSWYMRCICSVSASLGGAGGGVAVS